MKPPPLLAVSRIEERDSSSLPAVFAFNLIYFLRKRRYELVITRYDKNGPKFIPILIGLCYLIFSLAFVIFTFYVLGPHIAKLIHR